MTFRNECLLTGEDLTCSSNASTFLFKHSRPSISERLLIGVLLPHSMHRHLHTLLAWYVSALRYITSRMVNVYKETVWSLGMIQGYISQKYDI